MGALECNATDGQSHWSEHQLGAWTEPLERHTNCALYMQIVVHVTQPMDRAIGASIHKSAISRNTTNQCHLAHTSHNLRFLLLPEEVVNSDLGNCCSHPLHSQYPQRRLPLPHSRHTFSFVAEALGKCYGGLFAPHFVHFHLALPQSRHTLACVAEALVNSSGFFMDPHLVHVH